MPNVKYLFISIRKNRKEKEKMYKNLLNIERSTDSSHRVMKNKYRIQIVKEGKSGVTLGSV